MQYKNQRTTMLLQLEMKTLFRAAGDIDLEKIEDANFDLEETLDRIRKILQQEGLIINTYRKDKLIVGLRKIMFVKKDDKRVFVKILWSVGDKDVVNPTYWNPNTDMARVTEKGDEEALGHSCHVVISLEKIRNGAYICSMERAPRMGTKLLTTSLNYIFRKLAVKEIPISEKKILCCYPSVNISIYPSETLIQTLEHGEITGIIMRNSVPGAQDFDEITEQTRISSSIRLRPKGKKISALRYLPSLLPAIKKGGKKLNADITDVTIQYTEENTAKSLSFEYDSNIEHEDEIGFNRTEKVHTSEEIPSFCEDFHVELASKMCKILTSEQLKVQKKHA